MSVQNPKMVEFLNNLCEMHNNFNFFKFNRELGMVLDSKHFIMGFNMALIETY